MIAANRQASFSPELRVWRRGVSGFFGGAARHGRFSSAAAKGAAIIEHMAKYSNISRAYRYLTNGFSNASIANAHSAKAAAAAVNAGAQKFSISNMPQFRISCIFAIPAQPADNANNMFKTAKTFIFRPPL